MFAQNLYSNNKFPQFKEINLKTGKQYLSAGLLKQTGYQSIILNDKLIIAGNDQVVQYDLNENRIPLMNKFSSVPIMSNAQRLVMIDDQFGIVGLQCGNV